MVRANNLLCDIEHTQKHFETTQEMVNRGMVGVEAWLTGKGLVTHGSPAAREAMLIKYEGEGNIQTVKEIFKQFSKKGHFRLHRMQQLTNQPTKLLQKL